MWKCSDGRAFKTLRDIISAEALIQRYAIETLNHLYYSDWSSTLPHHEYVISFYGITLLEPIGIVMELADCDLRTAIQQGKIDISKDMRIARDIANGMKWLVKHGVYHRDLKTRNVLLKVKKSRYFTHI